MFQIDDEPIKIIFKSGDRVECIEECPGTKLVKGMYTVNFVDSYQMGDFLNLVEIQGGWEAKRFRKR